MTSISFRPYGSADRQTCIDIFDANCPEFFAPNERDDYEAFLAGMPAGYEVCEKDGVPLGAFGVFDDGRDAKRLNWIMLASQAQGLGVGSEIMRRVIQLSRTSNARLLRIATSPKSAAFFEKFGARAVLSTPDGWGPGMDRVDLELVLSERKHP